MERDTLFVFLVVGIAAALFASGRVRLDIVAMGVVIVLAVSGILTTEEALSGFGDPVVILVAALLVVGEGLTRTGVSHRIGGFIGRVGGGSETRFLVVLMLVAAGFGAVMSSTAIVAIFIPVVVNLARKQGMAVSRLLIPLSFAALISGMLTLIATTPNLVVASALEAAGFEPFGFFTFTPIGLAVLAVAIVFMVVVGRRLLPSGAGAEEERGRGTADLLADYGVARRGLVYRVPDGSVVVGRTLEENGLAGNRAATILVLEQVEARRVLGRPLPGQLRQRTGDRLVTHTLPRPDTVVLAGAYLMVQDTPEAAELLGDKLGLEPVQLTDAHRSRWYEAVGTAVVLIHPESRLVGSSVRKAGLRTEYGVQAVAIQRHNEYVDDFVDASLEAGDALLVTGPWERIRHLGSADHDFVLLTLPTELEQVAPHPERASLAIGFLGLLVFLSVVGWTSVTMAVLIAAMGMILTRCLTMEDAYRAISWSTIVLIAGMLPVALALESTGGVDVIVDALVGGLGDFGPHVMLVALFALAAGLGLFLSNTATAVLLAPIAITAAEKLEVSPYAFAMTVAIAASAAFSTPVSTPVTTLVMEPGRYAFMDFVKVGVPLVLLTLVVCVVLIPLLFPFG